MFRHGSREWCNRPQQPNYPLVVLQLRALRRYPALCARSLLFKLPLQLTDQVRFLANLVRFVRLRAWNLQLTVGGVLHTVRPPAVEPY